MRRRADWIGDIERWNCILWTLFKENWTERLMGRRERRRKQLLDELKEERG
jgi:hypothetical protein